MKKATKTKRKSAAKSAPKSRLKRPVKKLARAEGKALGTVARKAKRLATPGKRTRAAPRTNKKNNVVSFSELLELKRQKANTEKMASPHPNIPPHELPDRAIQECKPQAHTRLRSGMQGLRHK